MRSLLAGVLAGLTLLSAACLPAARTPEGTYWLHDPIGGARGASLRTVVFADGTVAIPGACRPVRATFTALARGAVAVDAHWDRCDGFDTALRMKGTLDGNELGTFDGEIEAGTVATPVVATTTHGSSLRIATYNIQMIPSFQSSATELSNAPRIAKRVIASAYDVIAFNEVFDEEVQDALVDALDGTYHHYVSFLDGPSNALSDSGLMLFSRMPFADLHEPEALDMDCEGSDCSKVAFHEYSDCTTPDCHSAKGVGLVRIRNPETGEFYNVAFTHMQASYPPATYPNDLADPLDAQTEYVIRQKQLAAIQELLEDHVGAPHLDQEAVFVMGDINVDGDLADFVGDWEDLNTENLYEWDHHFGTGGAFFFDSLRDGWAYSNAPQDPSGNFDRGLTNRSAWGASSAGARLDYILMNTTSTPLAQSRYCIQHMTLTHNLRFSHPNGAWIETGLGPKSVGIGGTSDLSDHYGVAADVNLASPHCSPATAQSVDPTPGVLTVRNGQLDRPGQIHWLRFESEGTYSFEMTGADGVDYRVYQGTDMTTPVSPYKDEITDVTFDATLGAPVHFVGHEYRMAKAPFYVRVYHPDAANGDWALRIVKHDCSTPELACALAAGQRVLRELQPNPPVGQPDESWFELYSEAIPSGQPQQLVFVAGEIDPAAADVFDLEVHEVDANGDLVSIASDASLAPDPASNDGGQRLDAADEQAAKVKYFLQVRRTPPYAPPYPVAAQAYTVHWETNLTILFGAAHGGQSLDLRCLEENDGPIDDGDDEVYLTSVSADGQQLLGGQIDLGDFDAGNPQTLEGIVPAPIYFFGEVAIQGFEDDGFLSGDVDWMSASIGVLGPFVSEPQPLWVPFDPDNGGHYEIYFNLTHGFDQ